MGEIAPLIQKYISEKLQLKAEVPALRLLDNGVLSGDDPNNDDFFATVRCKAADPPDVDVGPDSNPTLSFTSGSEGRPKGVLGRHFSLVKYFPWMAERFNLSSESRFTLLSGIAHDPVQRDIFTPLFLGAQILVPSREDIQHEKLAEWMAKYKPTVTHLTPAMGQILVGGASAEFPHLNRAFFVGDILTSKDCRRLQRLAPNVNIVNMYGTTETQRAVSYFEIPSRSENPHAMDNMKDIIPVGQGMKNVQLLVVSLDDRSKLCKIGEVGEIYVRAAGLAESYKGDQAMSDEKFHMNWFIKNEVWLEADKKKDKGEPWRKYFKGPRDRLYRTGDLGKYLESGDVECTGRVDDQVKIRGFRIELNDIDINLNQHSLVRDCKTLLRRDKYEELKLISYIVVDSKLWYDWLKSQELEEVIDEGVDIGLIKYFPERFRRLQIEIRDHLKSRLPEYAIPAIIIFLDKLPLNPNGKIDKPKLPFPDIAELTANTSEEDLKRWESLSPTEQKVASLWAELICGLNAKRITQQDDFFDLGGHSILAQQMLLHVRRETGALISIYTLYQSPTLREFSAEIEKKLCPEDNVIIGAKHKVVDYAKSLEDLVKTLPTEYQTADPKNIHNVEHPTVLVTGATGFLGNYIIKDILGRTARQFRVVAHIRGAKEPKAAFIRLKNSLIANNIWQDSWEQYLSCVVGDLSMPKLGISSEVWDELASKIDIVIHNGASVHWVKSYQQMLAPNVISTIDAMSLCNIGKPKIFAFVSSTSVLDTDHYISLNNKNISLCRTALECDDVQGSRSGLKTGYGQTKWVSEQLVLTSGLRGLCGSIIRPGYILGDKETGVCNTDDFLVRMLKGCVQISARPRIINTINAIPVNHVARLIAAASLNPLPASFFPSSAQSLNHIHVIHGAGHPCLRMNEFLASLDYYGFSVQEVDYDVWKNELDIYISSGGKEKDCEQHALMPLYHFCMSDLPATTRAPDLDDRNAIAVLRDDARYWTGIDESAGDGITREDVGKILAYLVEIGFMQRPNSKEAIRLPALVLSEKSAAARRLVGGRAAMRQF